MKFMFELLGDAVGVASIFVLAYAFLVWGSTLDPTYADYPEDAYYDHACPFVEGCRKSSD